MRRILIVFTLLVLLSLACNLPTLASSSQVAGVNRSQLMTPDPNATVTPTPFQPASSAGVAQISESETTQLEESIGDTGPIVHNLKMPAGQVNIMVLGSDYRVGGGSRTDVMMLFSINTKKSTVSVISFPRDTYVYVPGRGMDRLNTPYAYEGFSLLADTMEYNFGVRPDHYILTNFYGFKSIINTLGGLNVYVGSYLSDRCDLPIQNWQGYCTVNPGAMLMDGDTALWYVRSRHSTSDLDRTRREQEVMEAFFRRIMSLDAVTRAPELYNQFINSVETDLKIDDLLPLVGLAPKLLTDDTLIHRTLIGADLLTNYTTDAGAMVLIPDRKGIWEIIKKEVYGQ